MRHLEEHEEKTLARAMLHDIYQGLKPTLNELAEKHCMFCAASAVGNGTLNAGLWLMCMPYAISIARKLYDGADVETHLPGIQNELYGDASVALMETMNPYFAAVRERMEDL